MATITIRRAVTTVALLAAFGSPLALAESAGAKGGAPTVQSSGACTGGGVFKLKAKHDDNRIEVEYEVDTNRVGQIWHVTLTDNGVTVFDGTRRTTAPSGSFTVNRLIANRAGADTIVARATSGARSCGGSVTL